MRRPFGDCVDPAEQQKLDRAAAREPDICVARRALCCGGCRREIWPTQWRNGPIFFRSSDRRQGRRRFDRGVCQRCRDYLRPRQPSNGLLGGGCHAIGQSPGTGRLGASLGPTPYRGLAAFFEEDAERFFGRDKRVARFWEAFRALHGPVPGVAPPRILPILGPSGSGKSSLARAGLVPEIARHALPTLGLSDALHPIRRDIGADRPAFRAHHARTE